MPAEAVKHLLNEETNFEGHALGAARSTQPAQLQQRCMNLMTKKHMQQLCVMSQQKDTHRSASQSVTELQSTHVTTAHKQGKGP